MTFLEKLDLLMSELNLNKMRLSQLSGVPYTTIDGFYKKGYENAKISTIRKLAKALDVSLDYLIEDEGAQKKSTPPEDEVLLSMFHKLNEEGKERLLETADDMVRSEKYIKNSQVQMAGEA